MRAIRDIATLEPGSILYHPAFGFARIAAVEKDRARLRWEKEAPNLPSVATLARIAEVCSLCRPHGFFARSFSEPEALAELMESRPVEVVRLLLSETVGPMSFGEIRHWLVERSVVEPGSYEARWRQVLLVVRTDGRFVASRGQLALRVREPEPEEEPGLELTAEELLAGALEDRAEMPEQSFTRQVVAALGTGPAAVRKRALDALTDAPQDIVADALLARRPTPVDAVLEWLARRTTRPELLNPQNRRSLAGMVAGRRKEMDTASRGAIGASLVRRGLPLWEVLGTLVGTENGRPVVNALVASLDRDERLAWALDLWARLLQDSVAQPGLPWLQDLVLEVADTSREELAKRIVSKRPVLAARLREERASAAVRMPSQAVPRGTSLLTLGAAMARALADHHTDGHLVNPVREAVHLRSDGSLHLEARSDRVGAGRLPGEPASAASDVYSAAVVLMEIMLGRPLPEGSYPFQLTRYLRSLIPEMPVGAMAPLDAALHPEPEGRPRDGLAWVLRWQAAGMAHQSRAEASWDAQLPAKLGYDSHVGRAKLLITQTNQDALFLSTRGGLGLLVVCDGISTATVGSGDMASAITVYVISKLWEQQAERLELAKDEDAQAFLTGAFEAANAAICEAAMQLCDGDLIGRIPMGTTAVAALLRGNRVTIGWLGDSRSYLVGPYGSELLTTDMNQSMELAQAYYSGHVERLELGQFALTGYLGHFAEDLRPELLRPSFLSTTLLPAERLVLCSDGVTDYIAGTHPELASRLTLACQRRDPDEAARFLVDLANQGGGGDNCTAIVTTLWHA